MFAFRNMRFGRRGWLRPWVLSILAKSPKNGAELMDEIERSSWGSWRPSPGSIYPLLEEMSSEGLIAKQQQDGRYILTEKGKSESEWSFGMPFQRPRSIEDILKEIGGYASYFEDLKTSDSAKIAPYYEQIRELGERLTKLGQK